MIAVPHVHANQLVKQTQEILEALRMFAWPSSLSVP